MFRKKIIGFVFLALIAVNAIFSQAMAIDTAISNAAKDFSESVPQGTRIAVLNISSDFEILSDYIINELIVNLVNTRKFQVVPRSAIELELANREFDFQMTGSVSDESQKSLGQFLGAGTIISGSVVRDAANTYRLIINAIHLESFTFQSSFRASIQNDRQLKALIAGSGGVFYEDYTVGQRFGMAGLNIFGGAGSLMNGHRIGWVTAGAEIAGIALVVLGLTAFDKTNYYLKEIEKAKQRNPVYGDREYLINRETQNYESAKNTKKVWLTAGGITIGAGVVFGLIIPFFHHKPNQTIARNDFPLNFEFVSTNEGDINGIRLLYNMKF